jgi:hypothetical protein
MRIYRKIYLTPEQRKFYVTGFYSGVSFTFIISLLIYLVWRIIL